MSEPGTCPSAAARSPALTDLLRSYPRVGHRKTPEHNWAKQDTPTPDMCKDLQSPQHRGCSRFPGLNYGDSPGDGEVSQDIIWDSTSPSNKGLRNTRVVEISDIVNRIAPKDLKPKGSESPLLQWIDESAAPCTPELPRPRVRKKFYRQNSVDDLVKLARQFDENMQQDKETSKQLNTINNNLHKHVTASGAELTEASFPSNVKTPSCLSSEDQLEKELHALFDSSTQRVSGRLSQGSSRSACSQERTERLVESRRSQLESADGSGSAAHPAGETQSSGLSASNCDDFDDDWENDDLLNDSFVLAMTQYTDQQPPDTKTDTTQSAHNTKTDSTQSTHNTKTDSTQSTHNTKTNSTQSTHNTKTDTTQSAHNTKTDTTQSTHEQGSDLQSKPSCSVLQELCPKIKTSNRSTFKLDPHPLFQRRRVFKDDSKAVATAVQPKLHRSQQNAKTPSTPQVDKRSNDQREPRVAKDVVKDISDSLWDDGDDDALLYQVCDRVERISNTQPLQSSPDDCRQTRETDSPRPALAKPTAPLPIDNVTSTEASTKRQSPCAFVRSHSLPGTKCESLNYRGWTIPLRSDGGKSHMSHSLPGSHATLGTFSKCTVSSGTFQVVNADLSVKPQTVTAGPLQNSKTQHAAFKRNVADSAVTGNKVFVTSEMTGKCSAAEIERKKQEAVARRRLRMQNTPKP